jgi:hypothetical protein
MKKPGIAQSSMWKSEVEMICLDAYSVTIIQRIGCSSVTYHLAGMFEELASIPNTSSLPKKPFKKNTQKTKSKG